MPWFVLPDNRIVGGGVQSITPDMATEKYPAGEWACWSALTRTAPGPAKGRTPVEDVIVLRMDMGSPTPQGLCCRPCAECDDDSCEEDDYICVFCRYQEGK